MPALYVGSSTHFDVVLLAAAGRLPLVAPALLAHARPSLRRWASLLFRAYRLLFRAYGLGVRAYGLGVWAYGLGVRADGLPVRAYGLRDLSDGSSGAVADLSDGSSGTVADVPDGSPGALPDLSDRSSGAPPGLAESSSGALPGLPERLFGSSDQGFDDVGMRLDGLQHAAEDRGDVIEAHLEQCAHVHSTQIQLHLAEIRVDPDVEPKQAQHVGL